MKLFITFIAGVALGSLATWKIVEKKYDKIVQDEIESVKEVFSKITVQGKKDENKSDKDVNPVDEETKEPASSKKEYFNYANKYRSDSTDKPEKTNVNKDTEKPYVISPDEVGELDDYEVITLTHYADGVLTDDRDEIIENAHEIICPDYSRHFGEYEEHAVFVRNDRLKCDYEIMYDEDKYSDLYPWRPSE